MNKIDSLRSIIEANKGKFFSVTWVKADGTLRTISNAQMGIKQRHLGANPVAHLEKYATITESIGKGQYSYKNVNLETVSRLAIAGQEFKF